MGLRGDFVRGVMLEYILYRNKLFLIGEIKQTVERKREIYEFWNNFFSASAEMYWNGQSKYK